MSSSSAIFLARCCLQQLSSSLSLSSSQPCSPFPDPLSTTAHSNLPHGGSPSVSVSSHSPHSSSPSSRLALSSHVYLKSTALSTPFASPPLSSYPILLFWSCRQVSCLQPFSQACPSYLSSSVCSWSDTMETRNGISVRTLYGWPSARASYGSGAGVSSGVSCALPRPALSALGISSSK